MFPIRINNKWNYPKTANYRRTVPLMYLYWMLYCSMPCICSASYIHVLNYVFVLDVAIMFKINVGYLQPEIDCGMQIVWLFECNFNGILNWYAWPDNVGCHSRFGTASFEHWDFGGSQRKYVYDRIGWETLINSGV